MSGNYMNAPSDRVAWDRDGSVFSAIQFDGTVLGQPVSVMRTVNTEGGAGWQVPNSNIQGLAIVFPIPMDIAGIFLFWGSSSTVTYQTSKDTTNGLDGTWTTQKVDAASLALSPNYRQLAQLELFTSGASTTEVRGVRAMANFTSSFLRAFHVYATPSSTATDDRLVFWHPTSDAKLTPTYFDWGDVPRGTTEDRSFRVKNLSTNRIAKGTVLFIEALVSVVPPIQGMFLLSDTGGATFVTSLTLPDLDPGEISDVLICRRTIPTNALVSVWTVRMIADVLTWQEV